MANILDAWKRALGVPSPRGLPTKVNGLQVELPSPPVIYVKFSNGTRRQALFCSALDLLFPEGPVYDYEFPPPRPGTDYTYGPSSTLVPTVLFMKDPNLELTAYPPPLPPFALWDPGSYWLDPTSGPLKEFPPVWRWREPDPPADPPPAAWTPHVPPLWGICIRSLGDAYFVAIVPAPDPWWLFPTVVDPPQSGPDQPLVLFTEPNPPDFDPTSSADTGFPRPDPTPVSLPFWVPVSAHAPSSIPRYGVAGSAPPPSPIRVQPKDRQQVRQL